MAKAPKLPTTFAEVINLWPTAGECASAVQRRVRALGLSGAVTTANVRDWRRRPPSGSVPAKWLRALALAAKGAGFEGITYSYLTTLHRKAADARKSGETDNGGEGRRTRRQGQAPDGGEGGGPRRKAGASGEGAAKLTRG